MLKRSLLVGLTLPLLVWGSGGDVAKLDRYKKLCSKGNPFGCIGVGWFAVTGRAMTKNYKMAAVMFLLSCRAGNAEGCASLGDLYFQGKGVRRNLERAVALLEYGCKNGYTPACKIWKRAQKALTSVASNRR
jgi:TPR repeat protein